MNYRCFLVLILVSVTGMIHAKDHNGITIDAANADGYFTLIANGKPVSIAVSDSDLKGIGIAVDNLAADFGKVAGRNAVVDSVVTPESRVVVGSLSSPLIKDLVKSGKLDVGELEGRVEKYLITTISNPYPDVEEALVIAGSDRRGTIYGVYELSEQLGVSPWYDWADVPVVRKDNISIKKGKYTAGEPHVMYRGIFLNDEAPCLTSWVKNSYGTDYGDHRFYGRVCELILRLRGNFLWPAMWGWAFYADDPENSRVADEMGVIMGTSHHEPMARNHQEYARNRGKYGAWNYQTNRKSLDAFFREGIERIKGTEDVVTIGMRGDGDEAMSEEADVELLRKIIANQRAIIRKVTGKPANETPQVWALYKEVLDYYDKGLKAPDDVIYLLCDDNWGNVRRVPDDEERNHPGGFGLYYHVDYVGAPRNSKLLNVTPIQNMWEQLTLAADYGIDKMWILNVGDLKPMEYPITLFLDMAWDPSAITIDNLLDHPREFCRAAFGEENADEAARLLNLYSKYNGRITPEMLDKNTYNLETGEWEKVVGEYMRLEAEALRQYVALDSTYRDAYRELILFPIQLMGNLYEMYYAQAMNHKLYADGNSDANIWADRVEAAFKRDSLLMAQYNHEIAGGKWNGMMTQKHIGYTSWNDDFPRDICPETMRVESTSPGGCVFTHKDGVVAMEAEHFYDAIPGQSGSWTVIPDMGRTRSGVTLLPHTSGPDGAELVYHFSLPEGQKDVTVHVVVKSTLAFKNRNGHTYSVSLDGGIPKDVNFNANLNEAPENIYALFYPTVASRVVEDAIGFEVGEPASEPDASGRKLHTLTLRPNDPGIVFEKIVVDCGGYQPSFLFMPESPSQFISK